MHQYRADKNPTASIGVDAKEKLLKDSSVVLLGFLCVVLYQNVSLLTQLNYLLKFNKNIIYIYYLKLNKLKMEAYYLRKEALYCGCNPVVLSWHTIQGSTFFSLNIYTFRETYFKYSPWMHLRCIVPILIMSNVVLYILANSITALYAIIHIMTKKNILAIL